MPIATPIPNHLKGGTGDAPPGHRFQLYLSAGWQEHKKERGAYELDKRQAIQSVLALGPVAQKTLPNLRQRQLAEAEAVGAWVKQARTTAPLVTGVGIEHPTENGFAFLTPYGLPYLAASGVKGVMRRAAEELALGPEKESGGWDLLKVWRMFGFENAGYLKADEQPGMREAAQQLADRDPELIGKLKSSLDQDCGDGEFLLRLLTSETRWREGLQWRGAVAFWDALLAPAGDRMSMEVLTPHHKKYYDGKAQPSDCESPSPIPFLAVGAGAQLNVIATCNPRRLPAELREPGKWRGLLDAACARAFATGLGAKTAVGYGAVEVDEEAERQRGAERTKLAAQRQQQEAQEKAEREAAAALAAMSPIERELEELARPHAEAGPKVNAWIVALAAKQGGERTAFAVAVRTRMEALGQWDPKGKKPKTHQRTLAVIAAIEDK